MRRIRLPRYLGILGLLPGFALVFWMTALLASNLASLLVVGVNVHGLSLASYAGSTGPRPAPLSLRIIGDAGQDAGSAAAASRVLATPSAAPSGAVKPTPTLPTPTPTPLPTPTLPLPIPTPLPTPTFPVPTPTPTPGILPLPLPLPVPILPSLLPGILR